MKRRKYFLLKCVGSDDKLYDISCGDSTTSANLHERIQWVKKTGGRILGVHFCKDVTKKYLKEI